MGEVLELVGGPWKLWDFFTLWNFEGVICIFCIVEIESF